MDDVGIVKRIVVDFLGKQISFSLDMLIMTWVVMILVILFAYFGVRRLRRVPGKMQSLVEMFVDYFDGLTIEVLGEKMAKKYTPFIATLFIFICFSNWIGIFPPVFKFLYLVLNWLHLPNIGWLLHIPVFEEPTKFLSTELALGLMVAFFVHKESIKAHGFGGYLKTYAEPMFLFAPLNIIGEIAKVVSHSFRLFGNILGGSIIIVIVSHLLKFILLPPFLNIFFGIFVGAIQAFVFTMLAVTYIAVAVND